MNYLRVLIIFWFITTISGQKQYEKVQDWMGKAEKDKLRKMANELTVEALNTMRQVDRIRDQICHMLPFEVGMLMGTIREKYKSMLELYRMTNNKYTKASTMVVPHIEKRRPVHYIIRMEYIRGIEIDIYQLVYILQSMSLDDSIKPRLKIPGMPKIKTTKKA